VPVLVLLARLDTWLVTVLNGLARRTGFGQGATAFLARWLAVVEIALMVALGLGMGRPRAAARMLISVATVYVTCEVAGWLWPRQRPFAQLSEVRLLTPHRAARSFPSRHVASGLAMAAIGGAAHPTLGRTMRIVAWLLGLSRVMGGLHYPSDVLAAAVLARIVASIMGS
jgi:membrane-associated phospholipid phosphatase